MLPHMRHIQRLVREEHEEHNDRFGAVGLAKGMVREELEVDGWDDNKVCE